ncbi:MULTISPECIES: MarR family winged helix-turn-helix transcriptional regulator [Bradyrhizobium]|nr:MULTISPECIES: MarR family transcriptional regulator [Bradyrhizobium]MCP1913587.1 DNA-binding MarR family transcriptional regulator [Bradyrhizobium elkanii]
MLRVVIAALHLCRRCAPGQICAQRTYMVKLFFVRSAHIIPGMEHGIANLLGALSLAVMDRIEQGAREVVGRGGETPAALIVIGYGQGMTNDKLRRILGLSHSGTVRLVDRLVSDRLVERRAGKDGREVALHLTASGAASRNELLASRISAVTSLLDVLSVAERKQLATLIRELLARQDTSEMDRFTICRMCDDRVCTNCPLPTSKGQHAR